MDPERVRTVSRAALSLCIWVRAIENYTRVASDVKPKQEKVRVLNEQLRVANRALDEKQSRLREVEETVAALRRKVDQAEEKK